MADLSADDLTRIAREAVREQSLPVEIAGIVMRGDADYVEILVNVDACPIEPCQVSVGVFRDKSERELRRDIVGRLRRHLETFGPVRSS